MTEKIMMERQRPLVSVIMPAYNAECFIEDAILSVIKQTFTDWELIVIDDCSTDSTCAIVERLAEGDRRIHLNKNRYNIGVANTRNRGFRLCRGTYIALLDSDDLWHPQKLEKQLQLANDSKADLIYCSYKIVDEKAEVICKDFIVPEATDFEKSLTQSVMSCSTVLFSREIADKYAFDSTYYHEDLVMWLQLLRDGYVARGVTEVLAQYRVIKGSRAFNKLNSALHRYQIYRRFLSLSPLKSIIMLGRYAILGFKKYKTL